MLKPARMTFRYHALTRMLVTQNAGRFDSDDVRTIAAAVTMKIVPMTRFDMGPAALIRPFWSRVTKPETIVAPGAPIKTPKKAKTKAMPRPRKL